MKIYGFYVNFDIYESADKLISVHRTKKGAYRALNKYFWNLALKEQSDFRYKEQRQFENELRDSARKDWEQEILLHDSLKGTPYYIPPFGLTEKFQYFTKHSNWRRVDPEHIKYIKEMTLED